MWIIKSTRGPSEDLLYGMFLPVMCSKKVSGPTRLYWHDWKTLPVKSGRSCETHQSQTQHLWILKYMDDVPGHSEVYLYINVPAFLHYVGN